VSNYFSGRARKSKARAKKGDAAEFDDTKICGSAYQSLPFIDAKFKASPKISTM